MERKIGEIFECNGEWYQCVRAEKYECQYCDLRNKCTDNNDIKIVTCHARYRNDRTYVVFKKLEKVGEPVTERGRTFQRLNAFKTECTGCVFLNSERGCDKDHYIDGPCPDREIWVEIKQNKEDMEEDKLNLKPFDIQKAREGKPVCTRDGRKARLICFDKKGAYPIVALVNDYNEEEYIKNYDEFGKKFIGGETSDAS